MQIDRFPCKFDSYSIGINFGGWWPLQHHGKLGICANEDKRTRFNAFWYLSLYPPSNMAPIRGWWALYPESYTLRDGLIGKNSLPSIEWTEKVIGTSVWDSIVKWNRNQFAKYKWLMSWHFSRSHLICGTINFQIVSYLGGVHSVGLEMFFYVFHSKKIFSASNTFSIVT